MGEIKRKYIYIGLAVIFVLIIWFKTRKQKDSTTDGSDTKDSGSSSGGTYKTKNCSKSTVLKKWDVCLSVGNAQYQINLVNDLLGIEKLETDKKFGKKTEIAFQKLLGKKTGTYNEVVSKRRTLRYIPAMGG